MYILLSSTGALLKEAFSAGAIVTIANFLLSIKAKPWVVKHSFKALTSENIQAVKSGCGFPSVQRY